VGLYVEQTNMPSCLIESLLRNGWEPSILCGTNMPCLNFRCSTITWKFVCLKAILLWWGCSLSFPASWLSCPRFYAVLIMTVSSFLYASLVKETNAFAQLRLVCFGVCHAGRSMVSVYCHVLQSDSWRFAWNMYMIMVAKLREKSGL
jgi:hypothetical protein